jgi:hypothetical protein
MMAVAVVKAASCGQAFAWLTMWDCVRHAVLLCCMSVLGLCQVCILGCLALLAFTWSWVTRPWSQAAVHMHGLLLYCRVHCVPEGCATCGRLCPVSYKGSMYVSSCMVLHDQMMLGALPCARKLCTHVLGTKKVPPRQPEAACM